MFWVIFIIQKSEAQYFFTMGWINWIKATVSHAQGVFKVGKQTSLTFINIGLSSSNLDTYHAYKFISLKMGALN